VRCGEGDEPEERLVGVLVRVLLQALDCVIGNGRAGVIAVLRCDRRQRFVVFGVLLGGEVPVVVFERVGVVEAVRERLAVNVPLARVVRPISEWP
jgi:hypothetical protein